MGNNLYDWLWLVNCFGCGSPRIWKAAESFGSVSEAVEAFSDRTRRDAYLTDKECKSADGITREQLEELVSYCEKHRIYILTFDDEKYPERLKTIYNPPAVLFCRGKLECLENDFSIAVVGTRKPSDYSERVTASLAAELSRLGMTVISGFAEGIDITASLSAVRNGGTTIVVLGCGLDRDYPVSNVKYREEIEENGLFISEYYPLMGGSYNSFPARNRILSGLALGVIVTEAAAKSGALITANLALGQGKDIFAVAPHDLFDLRYGGNVSLIRDGAVCLCGLKDIVYEYYENYGHKIANAGTAGKKPSAAKEKPSAGGKAEAEQTADKPVKAKPEKRTVTAVLSGKKAEKEAFDSSSLDGDAAKVYNILKEADRPLLADELAESCEADISDMLMLLTELEMDGAVVSSAGGYAAVRP